VYSRIAAPAKRTSLKYGGDSPLATDSSRPTKGTNPDSPPLVTAPTLGMTWKKPDVSLPNGRAAFADFGFLGPRDVPAGRFPVDPVFADGSFNGPFAFAVTHFAAMPSAEWISEMSIWSCSFERTSK
jgi:hypothetical protein